MLTAAEQANTTIDGDYHAHPRARWIGRTLRITIECWFDPNLTVRDVDPDATQKDLD